MVIAKKLKDLVKEYSTVYSDDIKTHGPIFQIIEELDYIIDNLEDGTDCKKCDGKMIFDYFDGEKENFYCYKCNSCITFGIN